MTEWRDTQQTYKVTIQHHDHTNGSVTVKADSSFEARDKVANMHPFARIVHVAAVTGSDAA